MAWGESELRTCENCGCELASNELGWCRDCNNPEGDIYA